MFLANISIKKPVMTTMLIILLIIFGIIGYFSLGVDLLPDMSVPVVTVQTVYPGAGSQEVETQITIPLEEQLSTIAGIDNIESYSMNSFSSITVSFKMSVDGEEARQEVKAKVDAIMNEFPNQVEQPVVSKHDPNSKPVVNLVLSGNMKDTELFELADNLIKNRLYQIDGIAKVNILGGVEREIVVEIDNKTVFENQIAIGQISELIARHNLEVGAGSFDAETREYTLTTDAEITSLAQLENITLPLVTGDKKLSDIATVKDSIKKVKKRSTFFSKLSNTKNDNVILLSIQKSSDGNSVEIAKQIRKQIPILENELPKGCKLTSAKDTSKFIESSISDTMSNLFLGILLTALVLFVFLHDIRSTLIVSLSMPTSIIGTFMLLDYMGISLNMMSLMGLSTAVGVLVSNSIVVLENIFRHKEEGANKKDSARLGTSEVTTAVIASTLTNLVVFLPIANMSSMAGQVFVEFALAVTFATLLSLLMSFTLTPMLASIILPEKKKETKFALYMETKFALFENRYKQLLSFILSKEKYPIILTAITFIVLLASFSLVPSLGFDFFPKFDEGEIKMKVELADGFNLKETAKKVNEIENMISEFDEIEHILVTLGETSSLNSGSNLAKIEIRLVSVENREMTTDEVNNMLIKHLSTLSGISLKSEVASVIEKGNRAPLTFNLIAPTLGEAAVFNDKILEEMKQIEGLINIDTSLRDGKPEISLIPNRIILNQIGLTPYDLAIFIRGAGEGLTSSVYRDNGEEYDIRVKLKESDFNTPEKISSLAIPTKKGIFTVGQLARVEFNNSTTKIYHNQKNPAITFSGGNAPGYSISYVKNEITSRLDKLDIPPSIKISWGGDAEMMMDTIKEMAFTLILAILLTYMLLAALMESFTQPFLILLTLPMATIGVFVMLTLTGQTLSLPAMMGIIMLIGLVVNDAILMLDYTKLTMKEKNLSARDALLIAAPRKMKPVIMTTLAIVLGMLPMAMGMGSAGKEMRIPIGVVSIGGMITSTFLTLILIPSLFYLTQTKNTKKIKTSLSRYKKIQ